MEDADVSKLCGSIQPHNLSDALFIVANGMGGKKVTSGNLDETSHAFGSR